MGWRALCLVRVCSFQGRTASRAAPPCHGSAIMAPVAGQGAVVGAYLSFYVLSSSLMCTGVLSVGFSGCFGPFTVGRWPIVHTLRTLRGNAATHLVHLPYWRRGATAVAKKLPGRLLQVLLTYHIDLCCSCWYRQVPARPLSLICDRRTVTMLWRTSVRRGTVVCGAAYAAVLQLIRNSSGSTTLVSLSQAARTLYYRCTCD